MLFDAGTESKSPGETGNEEERGEQGDSLYILVFKRSKKMTNFPFDPEIGSHGSTVKLWTQ